MPLLLQVSQSVCPVCTERLPSTSLLETHMQQEGHCGLPPDDSQFSQDYYLKTVLESDPLLYAVEWGEGEEEGEEDVDMGIAQVGGGHGAAAELLAASSADPTMGVPGVAGAQGDLDMGTGREGSGREGAGGSEGWLSERMGGGGESDSEQASELASELSSNSQLASEVLALRRQNAELAIQLTQIQAEVAASVLSGGTPLGSFSRISAPSTPSRSPPVPLTPVNTPVHSSSSSSPRHTNPASLGAAFGAPGVAAGLSLGLRLKQRESQGQSQGIPPTPPSSLQDLQIARSGSAQGQDYAAGAFPVVGAAAGVPRPLPGGGISPAWGTPDRAPPTPFSTPAVSPSPSSSYLSAAFSAAAAAAALETVAALGPGFSLTGSESPSPGPSAAGTPRKTPRTPVSTPAMSPVPGYGGFAMTAADAQAAAAILAAWADRRSGRLGMVLEEGEEKEREEEGEEGGGRGSVEAGANRGEEEGEDVDVPDAEDNPSLNQPPVLGTAGEAVSFRSGSESGSDSGSGGGWGLRRPGRGFGSGVGVREAGPALQQSAQKVDASYFGSYGGLGIHREMLGDKVHLNLRPSVLIPTPQTMT